METAYSVKMGDLIIKFVEPNKGDDPSSISMAFEQCNLRYDLKPEWISKNECLNLNISSLSRKNVFILDKFSDSVYDLLRGTKALVIGTRCLLRCLAEQKEIPPWNNPIYSLALLGKTICCSGLDQKPKAKIIQYTQWMGGIFEGALTKKTTYLISNNVTSEKYSSSAGKIPILKYDWIEAVWNESIKDPVMGDCTDFIEKSIQKFQLPAFHGLTITTANIISEEKEKIKYAIENNGGVYSGQFQTNTTNVLVINENGINSKKYVAACATNKEIVNPDWIFDSVKAGYAVPINKYKMQAAKVSTPTKADASMDLTNNFSMISAIGTSNNPESTIDETITIVQHKPRSSEDQVFLIPRLPQSPLPANQREIKSLFNMQDIKTAGLFLDGCGIYVAGFSNEDKEFLYRIFNSGGATRYDEPFERVTHVILNNTTYDMKPFKDKNLTPHVVTIHWLIECVKQKQVVPEEYFTVKFPENSRLKAKRKLNTDPNVSMEELSSRNEKMEDIECQRRLIDLYKKENAKSVFSSTITTGETTSKIDFHSKVITAESAIKSRDSTSITDDSTSSVLTRAMYFSDRLFVLSEDLEEMLRYELDSIISDAGGQIISDLERVNYFITPRKIENQIQVPSTCHVVSSLFIRSCLEQQDEVEIQYYHKPIISSLIKPLSTLVFSISSYTGQERLYIADLTQELGGKFCENLLRYNNPGKDLSAATHLICKEANGAKYKACVNWGLPAVTVEWLLECYQTQKRALEYKYIVGETKAPARADFLTESNSTSLKSNESNNISKKINPNNISIIDKQNHNLSLQEEKLSESSILDEENSKSNKKRKGSWIDDLEFNGINKHLANAQSEKAVFSQSTPPPVSKILKRLEGRTSITPEVPKVPDWLKTPDTPYGAFLHGPNPSRSVRKRWKQWCENLPKPDSPLPPKTPSPTFSEMKKQLWDAILKPINADNNLSRKIDFDKDILETDNKCVPNQSEPQTSSESTAAIQMQLQKLNQRISSGLGKITPSKSLTPIATKSSFHNIDTLGCNSLKESQSESVGWRDPSELSPNQEMSTSIGFDEMQPYRKRPPVFILTGVEEKDAVIQAILDLGGKVLGIDSVEYDFDCSHILCDQLKRGEKLLAGISSGKWILSTDYISHCIREKRFIEEDLYEWGNPKGKYTQFPDAPSYYRWRCKLNSWPEETATGGAFAGWKVLIRCEKQGSFTRVIQAGLGQVIECSDIETLQEGIVTHCFFDKRRKLTTDEIRHLIRIGVFVLPVSYITNYLYEDPIPNPKEYLITV